MADAHRRRAIAYIAGRRITGSASTAVYDYPEARHVSFRGEVTAQNVNVYDHGDGCYVSGTPTSLYHYGGSQHIQLNVDRAQFWGYDYASAQHSCGTVNGKNVALYDYECSTHFNYSI